MASTQSLALGRGGEDLACRELVRRGYDLLDRRYRTRFGEIDIVARDGETVVFVEVKTRRDGRFGDGAEAVTWHKQQRLARLALEYLSRYRLVGAPCRFDVVSVISDADRPPIVRVFRGAFDVRSDAQP